MIREQAMGGQLKGDKQGNWRLCRDADFLWENLQRTLFWVKKTEVAVCL